MARSFVATVQEFEDSCKWLSVEDGPALTSLYLMAEELDNNGIQGPIISAFGLAYRSLLKRAPSSSGSKDELEGLLDV